MIISVWLHQYCLTMEQIDVNHVDAISPTGSGVVGPNRVTDIFVVLPIEPNAFGLRLMPETSS